MMLWALFTAVRWVAEAQMPMPSEWWVPLITGSGGAAISGCMVVWFAFRAEKILERLRVAMERNTNALMVSVLNTRHLDDALRPLAEKLREESASAIKNDQ